MMRKKSFGAFFSWIGGDAGRYGCKAGGPEAAVQQETGSVDGGVLVPVHGVDERCHADRARHRTVLRVHGNHLHRRDDDQHHCIYGEQYPGENTAGADRQDKTGTAPWKRHG